MRSLLLILGLCGWVQALDLTVNSSFSTNEDTALVFSYAEILTKCTVSQTPDRLQIALLEANGTLELGASTTGPWTTAAANDYINPTQFVRFTPTANLNGTKSMMAMRACLVAAVSSAKPLEIIIAPRPDPITIDPQPFTQPGADPKVTEDIPFTFTFADLVSTLRVEDVDGEAFDLVITGRLSGTLTTVGGTALTLPFTLHSGESFRWLGDLNVFTKTGESPISAFTVKAVNAAAPFDQTASVSFTTPVIGAVDDLTGVQTTLGSFDPIQVTRGITRNVTYLQLLALTHGTNAVDRNATYSLSLGTAANGCVFRTYAANGGFSGECDTFPTTIVISEGASLQIIPPASLATGTISIGGVSLTAPTSSGYSNQVDLRLQVQGGGGGSSGSSGSGGGGGGGCGAGSALSCLLLGCGGMSLLRRRKSGPCSDAG